MPNPSLKLTRYGSCSRKPGNRWTIAGSWCQPDDREQQWHNTPRDGKAQRPHESSPCVGSRDEDQEMTLSPDYVFSRVFALRANTRLNTALTGTSCPKLT